MANTNARDFDALAASWDDNPARVALTKVATEALLRSVEIDANTTVLDYGAGTGLVTLALAARAKAVCAADSSSGMLEKLREKAAAAGLSHVTTKRLDLETDEPPADRYDLVVCTMTLHHIADAGAVVRKLASLVSESGRLAVADLDPDDGEFHDDSTGVRHNGFDRAEMRGYFEDAGLTRIEESTVVEFEKEVRGKGPRRFTIFLVVGAKSD
jgi:2-polyprenyl-3-methyl-5-hydroxy-6-metoxy-1,4-benzoquinol methylase